MNIPNKILLVEDDIDDQSLFCEALSETYPNISCDIANTAIQALDMMKDYSSYRIIFLDLNMPKMDGFQFLEVVKTKEQYKDIPVVIISTSSRETDVEKCKKLGATSFYTKQSSFTKLLDLIKEVLS